MQRLERYSGLFRRCEALSAYVDGVGYECGVMYFFEGAGIVFGIVVGELAL